MEYPWRRRNKGMGRPANPAESTETETARVVFVLSRKPLQSVLMARWFGRSVDFE
jgi:hypothetical protein